MTYEFRYYRSPESKTVHVAVNTQNYGSQFSFLLHLREELGKKIVECEGVCKEEDFKVEKLGGDRRSGMFSVETNAVPAGDAATESDILAFIERMKKAGFTEGMELAR